MASTKQIYLDLKADIQASKEYHAQLTRTIEKLLKRQKETNERIDTNLASLEKEMTKRCESNCATK